MLHEPDRFEAASPTIELDTSAVSGLFSAVLTLCWEHDLVSSQDLERALQSLFGNVLVDLTNCQFIDSSIIRVLLRDHQSRRREGQRLELLVPAANSAVTDTLKVAGVGDLLTVHTTAEDGSQPTISQ
jgi:anti-anti-sigma factor